MNLLKELYFGNLNPLEKSFEPDSPYECVAKKMNRLQEQLQQRLTEEGSALLQEFSNAALERNVQMCGDSFVLGVRVGAQILRDACVLDEPE